MKHLSLAAVTLAAALALAAPAFAAVRCYSVFNIEKGRVETICTTGN